MECLMGGGGYVQCRSGGERRPWRAFPGASHHCLGDWTICTPTKAVTLTAWENCFRFSEVNITDWLED